MTPTALQHSIYWGGIRHSVLPVDVSILDNHKKSFSIIEHRIDPTIRHLVSQYAFLEQVHGIEGTTITSVNDLPFFDINGDFLITQLTDIALGVVTADCLPLVIYDPIHQAIGIAHAGWRGTVGGIAHAMFSKMHQTYGSDAKTCMAFFGPSARVCCYEVGDLVINAVPAHRADTIKRVDNRYHFNIIAYNTAELCDVGFEKKAIQIQPICTMCDNEYWSYRRSGTNTGFNISFCWLKA